MTAPRSEPVTVVTPTARYCIHAHPGALDRLAELPFRRALVVADENLPGSLLARAQEALTRGGARHHLLAFHATERTKSLDSLAHILHEAARLGLDRSGSCIVALGGGIVGDVAGFAAASYQRGIPVVQCPTTLLAMVDASTGGKTGVNLAVTDAGQTHIRKNYAGAFHHPHAVLADTDALASLPERVFRSGLAECVKHALLSAGWQDPGLLAFTAERAHAILERDPATLGELVCRNVAVKARVVADDEHERNPEGGRALLNLGHTFAHAIEPLPTLSPSDTPAEAPLHHGEAVALGLVAAAHCSHTLGMLDAPSLHALVELLARLGLPLTVAGLPDDEALLRAMQADKKAAGGTLRLILPITGQHARVVSGPDQAAVVAGWHAIRADGRGVGVPPPSDGG